MSSRMGKRLLREYTDEELRAQALELERAITIPVNVEIKADHRVLDLREVEKILKQAKKIGLQDCGCRMDQGNCEAPRDVCISIDLADDYVTKFARYHARECTRKEALKALKKSHEAA